MKSDEVLEALRHMVACHEPDANGQIGAVEECAAAIATAKSLIAEIDKPKWTYGHCENGKRPGGCQLHNLHCGYPSCDRRPV